MLASRDWGSCFTRSVSRNKQNKTKECEKKKKNFSLQRKDNNQAAQQVSPYCTTKTITTKLSEE
jgi:hypothetical protein